MPTVIRKLYVEETEEELLEMTREDITEGLTDREQKFCEFYCKNMNIKLAAIKAGYGKHSAHMVGYKVRRKYLVNRYICWLKLMTTRENIVSASDIVDKYIRIAFADITDFVKIKNNKIVLLNDEDIDGQLVKQVKQGKDGVTIELYDKLSALDKLERYFDVMPKDWRQKIEEKKLEIMQQRLEIEKTKMGLGLEDEQDDGFIEALKGTVQEVWDGTEDVSI